MTGVSELLNLLSDEEKTISELIKIGEEIGTVEHRLTSLKRTQESLKTNLRLIRDEKKRCNSKLNSPMFCLNCDNIFDEDQIKLGVSLCDTCQKAVKKDNEYHIMVREILEAKASVIV